MIRVAKSEAIPSSLQTTKAYDGEDVKRQLLADQKEKCYLCERVLVTDFQIEHFQSQDNYPHLIQSWNNLLLSCGYCNGKKLHYYDDLLNPFNVDVEKEISQTIDYDNKKALFSANHQSASALHTVELLNKIFNGSGRIRKIKEEKFFEYFLLRINYFQELITDYLKTGGEELEKAIIEDLSIDKEFLGFKYWIICENRDLFATFADKVFWNKN